MKLDLRVRSGFFAGTLIAAAILSNTALYGDGAASLLSQLCNGAVPSASWYHYAIVHCGIALATAAYALAVIGCRVPDAPDADALRVVGQAMRVICAMLGFVAPGLVVPALLIVIA